MELRPSSFQFLNFVGSPSAVFEIDPQVLRGSIPVYVYQRSRSS
jgi:hypothetical protein